MSSDNFYENTASIKKEEILEQYLNLSPGGSLNSPGVGLNTSGTPYFNQTTTTTSKPSSSLNPNTQSNDHLNGYTRPVPGFKTDYDLQKANSQSDLSSPKPDSTEVPHIQLSQHQNSQKQDVAIFLDELTSLSSPSELRQLQFNGFNLDHQQSTNQNSPVTYDTPTFRASHNSLPTTHTPPPVIISTPPYEEQLVNQHHSSIPQQLNSQSSGNFDQFQFTSDNQNDYSQYSSNDFLNTDFSSNSFHQLRPNVSHNALSEISSVENSPYLSAYAPSQFDDDILSIENGNTDFLEYDSIGQNLNNVNLNDAHYNQLPNDSISRLTQENLTAVSEQSIINLPSPVTINIELTPDEVQKTPSLFSSNRSSANNSPAHSRANSGSSDRIKAGHYKNLLSPNAQNAIDDDSLLKPDFDDDSHSNMRVGRQRRQSRSRSNSENRAPSKERDRSVSSNREKMLELASPNQSNKRVQKHPSIYACHLCSKRFTRPYNLKSHLRTHTDERPFVCTVCGKAFARQHDRKRHEDLHTGKKRYECRGFLRDGATQWGCGKKFARTDALGRHFKTEAGKECIRPLVEEHEKELKLKRGDGNSLELPQNNGDRQFPDEIYNQFPSLLYGSQNNSGVSDISDGE